MSNDNGLYIEPSSATVPVPKGTPNIEILQRLMKAFPVRDDFGEPALHIDIEHLALLEKDELARKVSEAAKEITGDAKGGRGVETYITGHGPSLTIPLRVLDQVNTEEQAGILVNAMLASVKSSSDADYIIPQLKDMVDINFEQRLQETDMPIFSVKRDDGYGEALPVYRIMYFGDRFSGANGDKEFQQFVDSLNNAFEAPIFINRGLIHHPINPPQNDGIITIAQEHIEALIQSPNLPGISQLFNELSNGKENNREAVRATTAVGAYDPELEKLMKFAEQQKVGGEDKGGDGLNRFGKIKPPGPDKQELG